MYEAERAELASVTQMLVTTLSVAVAFIGSFVVATTALNNPLPGRVALAAPTVSFGVAGALVGLYANSVLHSGLIQRLEAFMSVDYRDEAGRAIARGESLGNFAYGGGGLRNLHFTLLGLLTYASAFAVLAGFAVFCLSLAEPSTWRTLAGFVYLAWWLLLVVVMARTLSSRRASYLLEAADQLMASNRAKYAKVSGLPPVARPPAGLQTAHSAVTASSRSSAPPLH